VGGSRGCDTSFFALAHMSRVCSKSGCGSIVGDRNEAVLRCVRCHVAAFCSAECKARAWDAGEHRCGGRSLAEIFFGAPPGATFAAVGADAGGAVASDAASVNFRTSGQSAWRPAGSRALWAYADELPSGALARARAEFPGAERAASNGRTYYIVPKSQVYALELDY
jgi:hypothetical protein